MHSATESVSMKGASWCTTATPSAEAARGEAIDASLAVLDRDDAAIRLIPSPVGA